MSNKRAISNFIKKYYLHLNAAIVFDAEKVYEQHSTPKFILASDATIVAPLIFACLLDM